MPFIMTARPFLLLAAAGLFLHGAEASTAPCNCPPEANSHVQLWLQAQTACLHYQQMQGWSSCLASELGWMNTPTLYHVNLTKIANAVADQALQASQCSVATLSPFTAAIATSSSWMWPGRYDYQSLDEALQELIQCIFAKANSCQENAYRRTIIVVKKKTVPGQDVFIKGGRHDRGPINIQINALPNQWEKYNTWALGDTQLDWNGMQDGQKLFNNWKALGTPLGWTSNDKKNPFFSSLNYDVGDNGWALDMDMDCSQSDNGWFEFNTIYSYGGESGEPDVAQKSCTGTDSFTPANSTNHIAKCGAINTFTYGSGSCNIIPISC